MLPDSQVAFWLALHHCLHVPRVTAVAVTSADPQRLECKVLLDMQRSSGMKQCLLALLSAKRSSTCGFGLQAVCQTHGHSQVLALVIVVLVLYNMSRGLKALSEPRVDHVHVLGDYSDCLRRRDGLLDHLWPEMDHQHHASSHVVIVVLEQETVVVRTAILKDEDELL